MAHQPDQVTHATADPATPPPYPEGTSSEQIRQDIRRTRQEMDQTVDALEERLRPRHLIDDLLDMFRSSGGGSAMGGAKETFKDAGYKVVEKLKQHPMPAALIGAGLVWLLFEDDGRAGVRSYQPRKWDVPEHSGSYVDARTGQPYEPSYGTGEGATVEQQPSMAEQARDKLAGAAESVKETARSVSGKIGDWTGAARDTAGSTAHAARDYASRGAEQVSRGYETSRHYLERGLDEYPLAMGAAALALGVLSGLVLPRTRTEDRWMGPAADELKDRARDAASEAVAKGARVAEQAGNEAARQGLHPGTMAEKVRHVAEDAKNAAAESARREGVDPQTLAHKGQQVAERARETARQEARPHREYRAGE